MPPRSSHSPHASIADVAACRASLQGGSRTFFAASLALPKSVREPATALYAFCRMADDAIDHGHDEGALRKLRLRVQRVYEGTPHATATDRAFADCVRRFAIPRHFPMALLQGFEWDAAGRRYENFSQLIEYGVRVAGTVGAMMALVMSVRRRELVARACDLGVAMQLTNIARDVGEDARAGRLYLPLEWMRAAGLDPEAWLARPVFCARLASVIERLLREADILYARSEEGLAHLPAACRPGMFAARLLYAEIGHEVARRRFDSVSQRAVVSWHRKARILADAIAAAKRLPAPIGVHMMREGEFLLSGLPAAEASVVHAPPESARERMRWPKVEDRVVWLVGLFERLERRDRRPAGAVNAS